MNDQHFSDFYKVPNIKFNIKKLKEELDRVHKQKNFNTLGITNFAVPINKIPGKEDSIKGHNIRGEYWTFPDESGKEVKRDKSIDESKYTEIIPEFKNTYFEEVYNLLEKFKLGRVRILLKEPRSTLSWHRDPEPRLHVPIITNPGCKMVIEDVQNICRQTDP